MVHALDKDTVEFSTGERVTTDDTLQFLEDWHDYHIGDTITVEPIKDMDEIQLLVRANSRRISAAALEPLFEEEKITII